MRIKRSKKTAENFPAAKLMLSEIKEAYKDECERNKNLENKASIVLTLMGVLLTIGINELKFIEIAKIRVDNFLQICLNLVLAIALIIMIIMLVLTTYNIYHSIKTRPYEKMSTEGFISENGKKQEENIAIILISIYTKMIDKNRIINNEKSKYIDKSIIYLTICVIAYVTYSLIYKITY
ncbi:hypothetical protein [Clostridium perfringens]|uniref:hypothetical protein n=1 Tax=Clostridium perfringens TaxID=1502 RepID=UPI000D70A3DA|nr:hypothetical protein [Clostridium perfringens]PWX46968.1 hypothetical protein CYK61_14135 [Clostridium perfringens]HAT4117302.1 hypothetical protein [Clostridium perfringens]HAT4215971.1 hypothetical protein [Clostridium perfringens]HAT4296254.1 hypothetical protein [Clostridium perfringens]HAT4321497.1 hypothetical protein [Clostridium perfringens]